MAVSRVEGAANAPINGADTTFNFGTLQQDDIVLIVGGGFNRAATDYPGPSTAGYTDLFLNTAALPFACVAAKRMGASPDTNVVLKGTANGSDVAAYAYTVFRGVDPAASLASLSIANNGPTASTNPDAPNLVASFVAGDMAVAMALSTSNDAAITVPSGYTNLVNQGGNDTNDASVGLAVKAISGSQASEDPGAFASWTTGTWRGFTLRLPAPAAPITADAAETGSAAETPSAAQAANADRAETGSAAESPSGALTTSAAIAETGSAADATSGGQAFSSTTSETLGASETESASASAAAATAESGAGSESQSATQAANAARAESGAAAESPSATGSLAAARAEAGAAADSPSGSMTTSATISEAGAVVDTVTSAAGLLVSITEAAAALETSSATESTGAARAESVAALETQQVDAAPQVNADAAETGSVAESQDAQVAIQINADAAEDGVAVESQEAHESGALNASVEEAVSLVDTWVFDPDGEVTLEDLARGAVMLGIPVARCSLSIFAATVKMEASQP